MSLIPAMSARSSREPYRSADCIRSELLMLAKSRKETQREGD